MVQKLLCGQGNPKTKAEIEEVVRDVIENRRKSGQLNDSPLTLHDLETIRTIFVDMLQAVFHPRINYADAVARVRKPILSPPPIVIESSTSPNKEPNGEKRVASDAPSLAPKTTGSIPKVVVPPLVKDDDDDTPPLEVPRLRKPEEMRPSADANGTIDNSASAEAPIEKIEDTPSDPLSD